MSPMTRRWKTRNGKSVDTDQMASKGSSRTVWSGSTLFAHLCPKTQNHFQDEDSMAAVLNSMEKVTEAGGEPEDVANDNQMEDQEPEQDNSDMEEEE